MNQKKAPPPQKEEEGNHTVKSGSMLGRESLKILKG